MMMVNIDKLTVLPTCSEAEEFGTWNLHIQ